MNNKSGRSNRIDALDGLKGLSIIAIILYYFFEHILPGGYLAVNLFLFIAGFLNFRHFYTADAKGLSVKPLQYYKKRFNRLFFPMLAMIIGTVTFILLFARDFLFNLRNLGLASLVFVNNFYQIINEQSYFVQAANPSAFTHLWYVSLLGQLILLTPIMIKLFYSWHRKPTTTVNMLLIVSVVSAILMAYLYNDGSDPTNVYYNLLTRAFAYTLGGAVGFLYPAEIKPNKLNFRSKMIFNIIGLVAFIALLLMVQFMYGTQAFAYRIGMVLFTIIAAILVIVSIHPSSLWSRIFSLKPFTFIGKRSYSYYLWFYPVYLIAPTMLSHFNLSFTWTLVIQFILIIILAEITYQLFERERLNLPIGQDFNWRKSKHQFNILRKSKNSLTGVKITTLIYMLFLVTGVVGLAVAPEQRGNTGDDLQQLIADNHQLAESTQSEDNESTRVINNIEGLSQQELLYANGLDVTFFGDSTLLAAADEVQAVFPKAVVDGEIGRQLYQSVDTINALNQQGLLKPTVVVMLGSNGTFTENQLNDFIGAIGPEKQVFFVTSSANRNWVPNANQEFLSAAQRFGNVHIIDWATYSNDNPEFLREDSAHPTEEGAQELAKFIAKEVYRMR